MSEELFRKYMKCGGGETLGDPRTPECVERDGQGQEVRYRDFHKGTIYWTSQTGACVWIEEKILQKWREMGSAGLKLGFPMADWKEARGKVYNRFQHGSISYNPVLDVFEVFSEGRSLQDLTRKRSIFITALIWSIGILIIFLAGLNNVDPRIKGIITLVTLLLGPLTSHLFNLVFKPPIKIDES